MKKLLYLGYYAKEMDWKKFGKFLNHAARVSHKSKPAIIADMISSSLKYNISLLEYFQFRFYERSLEERDSFAGTGYMYEYQLKMNSVEARPILEDKLKFLTHYKNHIHHRYASLQDLEHNPNLADALLANKSGKIVLKSSNGQCGTGVEVRPASGMSAESLIARLKETENDMAEEFVTQHKDLMRMSPSGLNTVRIITQLDKQDNVKILGARLRITVNSTVDNLAAGNIAAPIDVETGIIVGPGVYSDITKTEETVHPVTGTPIIGFQVPYWKESMDMVIDAAKNSGGNRSIGWDVAITDDGPELIEGNHNWCKLLWQLPVKKGLKHELKQYI